MVEKKKAHNIKHWQGCRRNYCEQLQDKKLDNLEDIDKLLETHNLSRLNQEEIENLNRAITSKEIESVTKNLPRENPRNQEKPLQ